MLITLAIILRREKRWTWPFYMLVPDHAREHVLPVIWRYTGRRMLSPGVVGVVWLLVSAYAFRSVEQT